MTGSVSLTVHGYDGVRTPSLNGSRPIGGINNLPNARDYCHRAMTGQRLAYVCVCVCYTHTHIHICMHAYIHTYIPGKVCICAVERFINV